MTLNEAIKHCEEVAHSYDDTVPDCKCAADHRQLAEWLKELKRYKAIENPEEIGMLRLALENYINGLKISKSIGYFDAHDEQHLEVMETVYAVLGRIVVAEDKKDG